MKQLNKVLLFLFLMNSIAISAQNFEIGLTERLFSRIDKLSNQFKTLVFDINGVIVKATDTIPTICQINNVGFDSISYSYLNRKNKKVNGNFICKFKKDTNYSIKPCDCSGGFMISANNARRGYVQINNKSNQEIIANITEIDNDTISKKTLTDFKHSSISMNCGFRPSRLLIAKKEYNDEKFKFDNWSSKNINERNELDTERETLILYEQMYLFLHNEKLRITIESDLNEIKLELIE